MQSLCKLRNAGIKPLIPGCNVYNVTLHKLCQVRYWLKIGGYHGFACASLKVSCEVKALGPSMGLQAACQPLAHAYKINDDMQ